MNAMPWGRSGWAALFFSLPLLLPMGCQHVSKQKQAYDQQEKALTLIDQGRTLEKSGSPLLALEKYNRAATVYGSPKAYFQMGRVFEGQNRLDEAGAAYQEALKLTPDYAEARLALLALGFAPNGETIQPQELETARQWAAAHAAEIPMSPVTEAAATSDSTVNAGEKRSSVLEEAAQERQPTAAEVRTVLFSPSKKSSLPSATEPANTQNNMDVVLGTYPYHYRKAQQLSRRQMYEQAALEYERAMQADPKQIDARLDLGDMMMKMGRQPRARFHFEKAMEDFPRSPRPDLKMGNYYLQLNRPDDARASFRKSIEKDPNYVEGYNNLAVMAMKEKKWDEAGKMLEEIVKIQPDYANAYLNRGIIASDIEKNKPKALENFKHYVELNGPRTAQVQRWIKELEVQ